MKLEIKNINLGSIIFSVYPLIIFTLSVLRVLLSPADGAEIPLFQAFMQGVLAVLAETLVMLVLSLVVAFVYNLFCSFGIKGIRIDIDEVETAGVEQE